MRLARVSLALAALAFAGFGAALLLRPALLGIVGVELPTPLARTEIRAFYGGLELGLAWFFAAAARRPEWYRAGLTAQAASLGGVVLARLAGMVADGSASDPLVFLLLAPEAAGFLLGAVALHRLPPEAIVPEPVEAGAADPRGAARADPAPDAEESEIPFPVLMQMIRSRDAVIYEEAFARLAPRAGRHVRELAAALDTADDAYTRGKFVELLGESGSPAALPVLARELEHPDPSVREWAAGSLERIGGPEAEALLRRHAAAHPDEHP